jgi:ferredoxin--NADP+ reductase
VIAASPAVRHLSDYDTARRFRATLLSSERLDAASPESEVRELLFELDRPGLTIEVGQSLAFVVPGDPEFGRPEHVRLYSVADLPERSGAGRPRVRICVRRCSYIDDFTGERYPGIAEHAVRSASGEALSIAGPFGLPEVPK